MEIIKRINIAPALFRSREDRVVDAKYEQD